MLHFAVVCYVVAVLATLFEAGVVASGAATVGTVSFSLFALSTVFGYAAALLRPPLTVAAKAFPFTPLDNH